LGTLPTLLRSPPKEGLEVDEEEAELGGKLAWDRGTGAKPEGGDLRRDESFCAAGLIVAFGIANSAHIQGVKYTKC